MATQPHRAKSQMAAGAPHEQAAFSPRTPSASSSLTSGETGAPPASADAGSSKRRSAIGTRVVLSASQRISHSEDLVRARRRFRSGFRRSGSAHPPSARGRRLLTCLKYLSESTWGKGKLLVNLKPQSTTARGASTVRCGLDVTSIFVGSHDPICVSTVVSSCVVVWDRPRRIKTR